MRICIESIGLLIILIISNGCTKEAKNTESVSPQKQQVPSGDLLSYLKSKVSGTACQQYCALLAVYYKTEPKTEYGFDQSSYQRCQKGFTTEMEGTCVAELDTAANSTLYFHGKPSVYTPQILDQIFSKYEP